MNEIQKKCPNPICNSSSLDLLGAIIIGKKSSNLYRCLKCRQQCKIERNFTEQKLTQRYINVSKI